jgi:hypothetical protein
MSLINDALKRAKAAQQPTQPARIEFRPVSDSTPPHRYGSFGVLMAVLGLFVMLGLLMLRMNSRSSFTIAASTSSPPATATIQPPSPAPLAVAEVAEKPATTPSPAKTTAQSAPPAQPETSTVTAVTNTETQATNTATAESAQPKPATPKVQAIVFNPTRPSAMINGRTVFVGDKVAGAKVLGINQDSVTLLAAGQTNVLTLEQ